MIHWKDPNQILFSTIANNVGLPWSYELIEKYKDSWDYYQMSYNVNIPWSERLIDEHVDDWDWDAMAMNENLPWSISFLKRNLHRIGVDNYFFKNNKSITGDFEIVNEFGHLLDWSTICSNNKLPWCKKDLLELWKDRIDWQVISKHNTLTCRLGCSAKNIDKYLSSESDFEAISHNQKIAWSIPLIDNFKEKWNWKALSTNPSLPWCIDFIDYYKDYIYWGKIKTLKVEHDESGNLLDYETFQTWKDYSDIGFESNNAVPWSLDLIYHFENKLELELLMNYEFVWDKAFKHYFNDNLITKIFSKI